MHQHKNRRKAEVEQKHLFVKLKEQNKASFGSDMARKGLGNSKKERKRKKQNKKIKRKGKQKRENKRKAMKGDKNKEKKK